MIGSFLNVCIHRWPRDESIVWPGSRCPSCGHVFEVNNPSLPLDLSTLLASPARPREDQPPPALNATMAVPVLSAPAPPSAAGAAPAAAPAGESAADTTAKRNRMAMLDEAGLGEPGMPARYRFSVAFLSGPHASSVKVIDRPRILIGREEGDIVTMDPESSRRHAMIEIHNDGTAWVIDLNSTNGVYVDGALIDGRAQLQDRTEFMCGRSTFMMMIRQDDPYGIV